MGGNAVDGFDIQRAAAGFVTDAARRARVGCAVSG
jgi:hypothetical protein